MKEVYKIINDTIHKHVASIIYDSKTNKFTGKLIDTKNCPFVFDKPTDGFGKIIPGGNPHPDSICLLHWLEDRVIPPNRDMLKEMLIAHNLEKWDWREMIKLNKGRTTSDYFSVEVEILEE